MDTRIVSGPARQLAAVIPALKARGIELLVVTAHRDGTPPSDHASFLTRLGIPFVLLTDSGRFDVRLLWKLRRVLRTWNPDIVQTHSYRPAALAYLLRLARPPWRWAAFFHGETAENRRVRLYHWIDKHAIRHADRVVVMSEEQRGRLRPFHPSIEVIRNAVVLPKVTGLDDPASGSALNGLPRPRLGVVGRLSHEKGVDVFLEAAAALASRGVGFSAAIIGDGPARSALEAQARDLGIQDRVHFLGWVPVTPATYRELDVVVLPSRSEGLPNVLLEAVAENRPTVATTVGGIPDVVGNSAAAVLVPSESPEALASGIQSALATGSGPDAVAARAQVTAHYTLEARIAALEGFYRELAAK